MEQRLKINETQPTVWQALYNLEGHLHSLNLSPTLRHLIKIRASQINSCAFCINMHTREALKDGETQQRLFLLSAWRETDVFTEEEKVAIAIAEEVTLISEHGLSEDNYKKGEELFGKEILSQIIVTTIMINAWNRIAVSTHLKP